MHKPVISWCQFCFGVHNVVTMLSHYDFRDILWHTNTSSITVRYWAAAIGKMFVSLPLAWRVLCADIFLKLALSLAGNDIALGTGHNVRVSSVKAGGVC